MSTAGVPHVPRMGGRRSPEPGIAPLPAFVDHDGMENEALRAPSWPDDPTADVVRTRSRPPNLVVFLASGGDLVGHPAGHLLIEDVLCSARLRTAAEREAWSQWLRANVQSWLEAPEPLTQFNETVLTAMLWAGECLENDALAGLVERIAGERDDLNLSDPVDVREAAAAWSDSAGRRTTGAARHHNWEPSSLDG